MASTNNPIRHFQMLRTVIEKLKDKSFDNEFILKDGEPFVVWVDKSKGLCNLYIGNGELKLSELKPVATNVTSVDVADIEEDNEEDTAEANEEDIDEE